MKNFSLFVLLSFFCTSLSFAAKAPWDDGGSEFVVQIKEIEIGNGIVRVKTNRTLHGTGQKYGCPENDSTFGWEITNPHHSMWLSVVTTAFLSNQNVKIWQPKADMCGAHIGVKVEMVGFTSP